MNGGKLSVLSRSASVASGLEGEVKREKFEGFVVMMQVHPINVTGSSNKKKGEFLFKCKLCTSQLLSIVGPYLDCRDVGNDDTAIQNSFWMLKVTLTTM